MSQQTTTCADIHVDAWIALQKDLGKAPNTVAAYARGITDFASFCRGQGVDPLDGRKGIIAAYLADLHVRPPGGGRAGRPGNFSWLTPSAVECLAAAQADNHSTVL